MVGGGMRAAAGIVLAVALGGCASSVVGRFPPRLLVPEADPGEVDAVLFLVGDAGETAPGRSPVLAKLADDVEYWSAALGTDSAVSVAFLGDIVYPDGMHARTEPEFTRDSVRLWNQIEVVMGPSARAHGVHGLFLAGNHDWGNMTGEPAIARALNLRAAIDSARVRSGAEVHLYPFIDDPGPVIRDVRENVRLLFVDTHWWLQERSDEAKDLFFERVEEAMASAGDREIVFLAHHPWASAGPHGVVASGSRSIGVLFLLSKSGTYVQDVNSPAHGELRDRLKDVFARTGKIPLIFAAGHDHSLQVLSGRAPGDPQHILISGAGSKLSSVQDTVSLRHAVVQPGYMRLVFRRDDSVDLFVNATPARYLSCPERRAARVTCMRAAADSFSVVFSDRLLTGAEADGDSVGVQSSVDDGVRPDEGVEQDRDEGTERDQEDGPPPAVPANKLRLYGDSVEATPGRSYAASWLHRQLMGDLNRDLWDVPFKVAVLNLDAVGGSLEPDEVSGGRQTLGLRFDGADGRKYQFRSIVKDASRAIPEPLRSGPVDNALQDQMAAQFPLSAMVVARLLNAAGVLVAEPTPVVMPDDPRLGEFRERFAGRMGWIEERPDEEDGDRPGFAGSSKITGTLSLYETLREDPAAFVDQEALLRARLIDLFVGDWDRHYDNWRWASFDEGERTRWDPIPRDRDWALARLDGVVPWLMQQYYPKYVGFGSEYPPIEGLTWASSNFDRLLLNQRTQDDFARAAHGLQALFTDETIEDAVAVLPEPYRERIGDELVVALRSRRDQLADAAVELYGILAKWVDIRTTDVADVARVEIVPEGLRVSVASGDDAVLTYDRTFRADETDEVRLHLYGGDDRVELPDGADLPIRLKVVGGDGDDVAVLPGAEVSIDAAGTSVGRVDFFHVDPLRFDVADLDEEELTELEYAGPRPTLVWDSRDWGHEWYALPTFDYASEFGLHLGASVTRKGFAFGHSPHANEFRATVLGAAYPGRLVLEGTYERVLGPNSAWRLMLDGSLLTQRLTRFWGLGNETTNSLPEESYETRRSLRNLEVLLRYSPGRGEWVLWAGPRIRRWGRTDVPDPVVFQLFPARGGDATTIVGGVLGISRDSRNDPRAPRTGGWIRAELAAYPGVADSPAAWAGARLEARRYLSTEKLPGAPVLHLGLFAETTGDDAPYFERASVGGRTSLPGFRSGRFRGDQALSGLALLRGRLLTLNALGGWDLGGHGVATAGRVWLKGEESETIHAAWGGGLWFRSHALDRFLSVTVAEGDRGLRTYLDLGFPF